MNDEPMDERPEGVGIVYAFIITTIVVFVIIIALMLKWIYL